MTSAAPGGYSPRTQLQSPSFPFEREYLLEVIHDKILVLCICACIF